MTTVGERNERKKPLPSLLAQELLRRDEELWTPAYSRYDDPCPMYSKLDALGILLAGSSDSPDIMSDLQKTRDFIDRAFKEFKLGPQGLEEGSWGFVVPPRVQRSVGGENDEYMNEWKGLCPILWHFDSDVAQRFLVGIPPFVVDSYGSDKEGKCGYMIYTPMFADMRKDLDLASFNMTGIKIFNDTFDLARQLGIDTIGLGATLPQFLFQAVNKRGYKLNDDGIELTTGHAGTVWLIGETVKRLEKEGYRQANDSIAILGTGSIGTASIAHLRDNLGFRGEIIIHDTRSDQMAKVLELGYKDIRRVETKEELLASSNTIICATTTPVKLKNLALDERALLGKVVIDDSQPGCFDAFEVKAYGGEVVWVIAEDSTGGELTRKRFDYGDSGPVKRSEGWGCEYETWAVKQNAKEGLGSIAVRRAVVAQDVRKLERVFKRHWIGPAPLQARGGYIK